MQIYGHIYALCKWKSWGRDLKYLDLRFSIYMYMLVFFLQLNSLQKDNQRLRSDLEREIGTRQTLELQIESKEQTINSLKTQLETKKHLLIEHNSPLKDPERAVSLYLWKH